MFIIWGSGKRKKVTKYTIPDICGCCGTGAHMNIIKIYNYGHISIYLSLLATKSIM